MVGQKKVYKRVLKIPKKTIERHNSQVTPFWRRAISAQKEANLATPSLAQVQSNKIIAVTTNIDSIQSYLSIPRQNQMSENKKHYASLRRLTGSGMGRNSGLENYFTQNSKRGQKASLASEAYDMMPTVSVIQGTAAPAKSRNQSHSVLKTFNLPIRESLNPMKIEVEKYEKLNLVNNTKKIPRKLQDEDTDFQKVFTKLISDIRT